MTTLTRRQQAVAFFVQQGWTPEQAAGIVANLEAESGLRSDALGDGGLAYGIAQWHPDRQAHFVELNGKRIQGSSFEDQLAFVHAELHSTEKRAGERLAACKTAGESGACVSVSYERPADQSGEANKRAAIAERIFAENTQPPAPIEDHSTDLPPQEKPMGALMFLPAILQMIPQLAGMFGKGGKAEQNQKLAQTVVDVFTAAVPGAVNTQQAVELAAANPTTKAAAVSAVLTEPVIEHLLEIGPTELKEARAANFALMQVTDKWWKNLVNPVLLVTLATLPLIYIIVLGLVPFLSKVSSDVIAQTIGTVIGLVLGGIMGFWMGQTYRAEARRTGEQPTEVARS